MKNFLNILPPNSDTDSYAIGAVVIVILIVITVGIIVRRNSK